MIVYIYPKCTTCQKAQKFLKDRKITYIERDIVTQPPTEAELKRMLHFQDNNIKKLLNTSGQLYRELELSKKNLSEKELFSLLSKQGMLVKRPFVIAEDFGLVGFKEKEWEEALNRL